MNRKQVIRLALFGAVCTAIFSSSIAQQSLTGTYILISGETTLTLTLDQRDTRLSGSLASTTGVAYSLEGQIIGASGAGVCSGADGFTYFETFVSDNQLTLKLIEPGQNNVPDYDKAQYLLFYKQQIDENARATTGSVTRQLFEKPADSEQSANKPDAVSGHQTVKAIASNEVSDPSWGFSFVLPSGWVQQKTSEGAILGHSVISGMILVLPHTSENMQQMQQELAQGLQEEGSYLTLNGTLIHMGQNTLSGDYSGTMNGIPVKAKGIGVLSPYGGGAYLIAVSSPDKLNAELTIPLESIARNLQFLKTEISDLMQYFAGNWSTFTTNTTTWICFAPNGGYSEQYEAVYSGNTTDGYGSVTGNWGAASQDNSQGRWGVQGNRESGQIIVSLNNGNRIVYNYKVHQENGKKYYKEYWINGSLYSKE